jgi:DGQHR domain-containing protein
MKFFFADTLDYIDPKYNFESDTLSPDRSPQLDDVYPHEYFDEPPYDGLLVSRNAVGGNGYTGKYTEGQRFRFLREGAREFLRYPYSGYSKDPGRYPIMGDCGAFSYIESDVPPVSNSEIVEYYTLCKFTHGVSVDHINIQQDDRWDDSRRCPQSVINRTEFTNKSAIEFLALCREQNVSFEPIGIVQSWSPRSAARYAAKLVEEGYKYIGLGGLAMHKTSRIYDIVSEVRSKIPPEIQIHLFGFNRLEELESFHGLDITSFDSTSPLVKAFKDDVNNYFSNQDHYTAIRVPQGRENSVKQRIQGGLLEQSTVQNREKSVLEALRLYAKHELSVEKTLDVLLEYEELLFPGRDYRDAYHRTLSDRPWEQCPCRICREAGIETIIFRGFNRNKRRGFHNLYYCHQQLQKVRGTMNCLSLPCIKTEQTPGKPIYSFVVDGKKIPQFATISRIKRDEDHKLVGYQRPEVEDHINDIKLYLDSQDAVLPNSLVIAFQKKLCFEKKETIGDGEIGTLQIDIGGEEKSGWIVDGQQRVAAMRLLKKQKFPVSVIGFESQDASEERKQFVLVNNTKPLPKSLVYELLPSIEGDVPPKLRKRQEAYRLLERLNLDVMSPFHLRVKNVTSAHLEDANIKDMSVLKMIENGMTDGVLSRFNRKPKRLSLLKNYWTAVSKIYPDAWGLPPKKSRLTHGVGIVSMGYLMDAIGYRILQGDVIPPKEAFQDELELLGTIPWTEGVWHFGKDTILPWNGIQNTGQHIDMVTNYLIRVYREKVSS